jgi:hypothetical protein
VPIAEHYRFNKEFNMSRLFTRCYLWIGYSFFAGWICYYIPFHGYGLGVANIDGKTEDIWTVGLISIMSNILLHHIQMMILMRSFSKPLIYAFTFSLACIPIVWVVIDFLSGTVLRNRHFMDILS